MNKCLRQGCDNQRLLFEYYCSKHVKSSASNVESAVGDTDSKPGLREEIKKIGIQLLEDSQKPANKRGAVEDATKFLDAMERLVSERERAARVDALKKAKDELRAYIRAHDDVTADEVVWYLIGVIGRAELGDRP